MKVVHILHALSLLRLKLAPPPPSLPPLRSSDLSSRYRHRHRQKYSSRTKHGQRNPRHERPRTRPAKPSACCPLPASAWHLVPKTAPLLCPTPSPSTINHHLPRPLCCSTRTEFLLPSGVLLAGERVRPPRALLDSQFSGSWPPWKAKVLRQQQQHPQHQLKEVLLRPPRRRAVLCLLDGETWWSSRWWLEEGNASRLSALETCLSLRRRGYLAGKDHLQRFSGFCE